MDSESYENQSYSQCQDAEIREKTFLHKIIIVQSTCHPSQQYQVKVPYDSERRRLDIGKTLFQIFKQTIPVGHQYQVFYYCDQSEYFLFGGMYPFQDYLFLNQQYVSKPVISVKIIRVHPPVSSEIQKINKKKRVSDRTIKQVLERVAMWRNLRENMNITLQEASKMIELPKKTLDDYFYQIKQGQFYGFNFEINIDQKIGVLRKFVKQNHKKKSEQQIKILEKFMIYPQDQPEQGRLPLQSQQAEQPQQDQQIQQ